MGLLISTVVWGIGSYFVGKKAKEEYPNADIKPISYSIYTVIFGFIFSTAMLCLRICKHTGNKKGEIISFIVGLLMVLYNLISLF